jgi:hypothetical protein
MLLSRLESSDDDPVVPPCVGDSCDNSDVNWSLPPLPGSVKESADGSVEVDAASGSAAAELLSAEESSEAKSVVDDEPVVDVALDDDAGAAFAAAELMLERI